jgi:Ser/Thr protein kinase RdoA (MazF antagonist)
LRRLAQAALADYDLNPGRLGLLKHGHNTTFRLDGAERAEAGGPRYVLRVNRPGWRTLPQIRSEMAWLEALQRDTALGVPRPVPNRAGEMVTTAAARGVPQERHCVLLRWVEGRFYRERISPVSMERIGRFTAHLHDHVIHQFRPPPTFTRPSVQWGSEEDPGDMAREMAKGLEKGAALITPEDLATFTLARHHLRKAMQALSREPAQYNLIHADLHHGNCLFHGGEARAVDFDDCGWGHLLYDLAVTQWPLQQRPDFAALQAAHLTGYRRVRPLPPETETLLPLFRAARTFMNAMYLAGRAGDPSLGVPVRQFVAYAAAELFRFLREQGH